MKSKVDEMKGKYDDLVIQKRVVRARVMAEFKAKARRAAQDECDELDKAFGIELYGSGLNTQEKQEVIRTKDWATLKRFLSFSPEEQKAIEIANRPEWVYEAEVVDTELWFQPHDYVFDITTPEGDRVSAKLDYYYGDFRVWDKDRPEDIDWREFNRVFRSDYRAGRVDITIPEFDRFLIPQEDEAGEMLWLEGEADAGV